MSILPFEVGDPMQESPEREELGALLDPKNPITIQRFVRMESKMQFGFKAITDHLARWDTQWKKIDEIEKGHDAIKKEQQDLRGKLIELAGEKSVDGKVEKKFWEKYATPFLVFISGVLSGVIVSWAQRFF